MNDKYVENVIKKVKYALDEEKYFYAGQSLYDLIKYGVIIGDDILVFLASELSDVFRNCFLRVKEFEKDLDKSIITDILYNVQELLDFIIHKETSLDSETKIKIFDTLIYIISNAERIQAQTRDLEESKIVKRRIYRGGIS